MCHYDPNLQNRKLQLITDTNKPARQNDGPQTQDSPAPGSSPHATAFFHLTPKK